MTNINWNGDAESAPFKSRFDDESENLILAETDTGTGLFEWDGSAWQFRGPVEMNGEDVSGIGSLTATSGNFDSVNTESATVTEQLGIELDESQDDRLIKWTGPTIHNQIVEFNYASYNAEVDEGVETTIVPDVMESATQMTAEVVVFGSVSGTDYWLDQVNWVRDGSLTVLVSDERGTPGDRTYADTDNELTLEVGEDANVWSTVKQFTAPPA